MEPKVRACAGVGRRGSGRGGQTETPSRRGLRDLAPKEKIKRPCQIIKRSFPSLNRLPGRSRSSDLRLGCRSRFLTFALCVLCTGTLTYTEGAISNDYWPPKKNAQNLLYCSSSSSRHRQAERLIFMKPGWKVSSKF